LSAAIDLDLQVSTALSGEQKCRMPDEERIREWITAAVRRCGPRIPSEVTVRIVGREEITYLNETYRQKTGVTNVLAFPFDPPDGVDIPLLGDIVICAPVVEEEAEQQHKTQEQHWAHMLVHGVLHLLGYDYISDKQANEMENLEIEILSTIGYPNPYEETETQ
jgi:probable rRNA maturation factor